MVVGIGRDAINPRQTSKVLIVGIVGISCVKDVGHASRHITEIISSLDEWPRDSLPVS